MATAKRTRSASKAPSKTTAQPANGNGEQHKVHSQPERGVEELIRVRAYELYIQRGFQDGSAQDDWLRAEAEVRNQERHT